MPLHIIDISADEPFIFADVCVIVDKTLFDKDTDDFKIHLKTINNNTKITK